SFGTAEMPRSYPRVNVADAWESRGRRLTRGWPWRVCDGLERRKSLPEPSARVSASGLEAAPHRRWPVVIDLSVKHLSEKIDSEYMIIRQDGRDGTRPLVRPLTKLGISKNQGASNGSKRIP